MQFETGGHFDETVTQSTTVGTGSVLGWSWRREDPASRQTVQHRSRANYTQPLRP